MPAVYKKMMRLKCLNRTIISILCSDARYSISPSSVMPVFLFCWSTDDLEIQKKWGRKLMNVEWMNLEFLILNSFLLD